MITAVLEKTTTFRSGTPADAAACGRICHDAFATFAVRHNFPPDFPSVEVATELVSYLLSHPRFFSVVAEQDGAIVGSNFLDERSPIAGVGPITVDPHAQNRRVGRQLMQAVLDRSRTQGFAGTRLLQAAYHGRSLALYASLGFHARESIACMQGAPPNEQMSGYEVRAATEEDLDACDRVCRIVHGHDRSLEVLDAIKLGTARVVEHQGRISGYATDTAYFGHAVGETTRDLIALIGSASAFGGPGILVPVRNAELFQWCLEHRLKVVHVMTLMTIGLYNDPAGAYMPSVLY